MRDTPRTDAAAIKTEAPAPFKGAFVRVEFARELERELAEADRSLSACYEEIDRLRNERNK